MTTARAATAFVSDDLWENLQQPAHPSQVEPQFRALLAPLDMDATIPAGTTI
jgi:hypothetical protein